MSFSVVFFHNPHFITLPITTISPISSSSSSSSSSNFKPRKSLPSSNRIFTITTQPKPSLKFHQIQTLSAIDTIIDFGKHKGKKLGTLPSSYLKWLSKNLRAGDSEYWAKLADEVLEDDVYKDRIEWEFAEKILHGSDEIMTSVKKVNSVSMLLEISERFGWDNEDKIGWSKINFELLGTSDGGRIPRLRKEDVERGGGRRRGEVKKKDVEEDEIGRRRRERRERMRQSCDGKTVNKIDGKGVLGKLEDVEKRIEMKIVSPFPGRESMLKKVMNKRRI